MPNKAEIDLIANVGSLKGGLQFGEKAVQEFAEDSIENLKGVEVTSEELRESFAALIAEIDRLIEENSKLSKSVQESNEIEKERHTVMAKTLQLAKDNILTIALLTAAYVKYGAQLGNIVSATGKVATGVNATVGAGKAAIATTVGMTAASTLLTGALIRIGVQVVAARAGLGGYAAFLSLLAGTAATVGIALDKTGVSVKSLRKEFALANEIIKESNGDIKAIEARLHELGMTAEEVGIEITDNWKEVKKSGDKLLKEGFVNPITLAINVTKDQLRNWGEYVQGVFDKVGTGTRKVITNSFDYYRDKIVELKRTIGDFAADKMGVDKGDLREQRIGEGVENDRKNAEEQKKIREINLAESLANEKELAKEKKKAAKEAKDDVEIANAATIAATEKLLKAHEKEKQKLIDLNKFQDEALEAWIVKNNKIIEQQQLINEKVHERQALLDELATSFVTIEELTKQQAENAALSVASTGQLSAMLDDVIEQYSELAASGEASEKELREAKEKRDRLETALHEKRLAEEAELQDRILQGIEREKTERKKAAQEAAEDSLRRIESDETIELNKFKSAQQTKMQILIANGASDKTLKEEELKAIEAERDMALETINKKHAIEVASTNDIEELKEINRRNFIASQEVEMRAIEQKAEAENKAANKVKENQAQESKMVKSLEEQRIQAAEKLRLASMEKAGATAEELHAERLRQIDAEEKRELEKTKNVEERQKIAFDAEQRRIAEKLGKKLDDVDKGKLLDFGGPKNRTEALAAIKKAKKQQQDQLAKKKDIDKAFKAQQLANRQRQNAAKAENAMLAKAREKANKNVNKMAGGKDDAIGGEKVKPILERLVIAAEHTNTNEELLIKAVQDSGGLA